MADHPTKTYWSHEFTISEEDLAGIAHYLCEMESAYDLMALARRVVQHHMRHDLERGEFATPTLSATSTVRLWDPAENWQVGDHVIVYLWSSNKVAIGEITTVERKFVEITIDDKDGPVRKFQRAAPGSTEAITWRQTVRKQVASIEQHDQTDALILEYGERIASQLLNGMGSDNRFIRLAGRWFVRERAVLPTEQQIIGLAQTMLRLDEPQLTEGLAARVQPPLVPGDAGLFGLYLALLQRPHLFKNVDSDHRPRWTLAGPPPGSFTARYAAYDPETYEVLCLADELLAPATVQRLWDLDLLRAVT